MQLYLSISQSVPHVPQDIGVCSVKEGLMTQCPEETQ